MSGLWFLGLILTLTGMHITLWQISVSLRRIADAMERRDSAPTAMAVNLGDQLPRYLP